LKDLFGKALLDYQNGDYTEDLITSTSISDEDVLPLPYLFRSFEDMPKLEQKALQLSKGYVLDVGCGSGSHSLYLQNKGYGEYRCRPSPASRKDTRQNYRSNPCDDRMHPKHEHPMRLAQQIYHQRVEQVIVISPQREQSPRRLGHLGEIERPDFISPQVSASAKNSQYQSNDDNRSARDKKPTMICRQCSGGRRGRRRRTESCRRRLFSGG
jgi:hypothetical protein